MAGRHDGVTFSKWVSESTNLDATGGAMRPVWERATPRPERTERPWLEGIMPPPLNLIISNVPGPQETRYFNGAKLLTMYPVSGIAPMTALNVTVYSYDGVLYFGLISARRTIPHLHDLRLCVDEAFVDLKRATTGKRPGRRHS